MGGVTEESAAAHSSYAGFQGGRLVRLLDRAEPSPEMQAAHRAWREFAGGPQCSCVGAAAVVRTGGYRMGFYPSLGDEVAGGLACDLRAFARERPGMPGVYKSFVAIFAGPHDLDERAFEAQLWSLLRALHDIDRDASGWDPTVSQDPSDAQFGYSFGGTAFFVVGLHPHASRLSRRFAFPAMVFNAHEQFRRLRASGAYSRVQRATRERELALQGSLNPNLAAFGERSEARQYSGRAVEADWKCPFAAHR